MKRMTLVLTAVLLLAAVAVWAEPGHHFRGHMAGGAPADSTAMSAAHLAHLTKLLDLSEAQQASVQELQQKLSTTVKPLFDAMHQKRQAIRDGLDKNASAAALGQLLIDSHKIGQQLKAAHQSFDTELTALLTPDQAAKFSSFQAMRQSFHRGPDGELGPAAPPQR